MKLFISYAHDNLYLVETLVVQILRDAGHEPWFDHSLIPGPPWKEQLFEAIEDNDAFVYALTPKSVTSEWCRWEFEQAVELGKPIVPVLLEKCDIPEDISQLHYVDFTGGAGGRSVARLLRGLNVIERDQINQLIETPTGDPAQFDPNNTTASYNETPQPNTKLSRPIKIGGLAALVATLIVVGVVFTDIANPPITPTEIALVTEETPILTNEPTTIVPTNTATVPTNTPTSTLTATIPTNTPTVTNTTTWTPTFTSTLTPSDTPTVTLTFTSTPTLTDTTTSTVTPYENSPFSAEELITQGNELVSEDNFVSAIEFFTQAIFLEPDSKIAYGRRAIAYRSLGEYDLAITDFDKNVELNPNYNSYSNRGKTHQNMQNYEAAIADFSVAIEFAPYLFLPYNDRAFAYTKLGNYESAIGDFNKVIELSPSSPWYMNRGIAYRNMGNSEAALADFSAAINRSPEVSNFYAQRGITYQELQEYELAISDYSKAIELSPDNPLTATAYERLGNIYYELEQFELALENYETYLELEGDSADQDIIDRVAELRGN